ncbi:28 kDa heat- and acid-stable phosphoprotein [Senna tora]|uniref:28 kDa heat- and acid-stable phosphoprotein n=1 Tax=Senna tora TaxID=362788 RepID=A0A834X9J5_9FABA|nr:28 kDa heat- and acid-stable phosphoprotein [Senna tora]
MPCGFLKLSGRGRQGVGNGGDKRGGDRDRNIANAKILKREVDVPDDDRRWEGVNSRASPLVGVSSRLPKTLKEAEDEEEEIEEASGEESEESDEETTQKTKGTQGVIEIENPNLVKPKSIKARDIDVGKTTELSRREREELEKQKAHERYMRLQEQGKTEQARKDLERLALIRQQRADAAKKREEEKAAKEQKKAEARK